MKNILRGICLLILLLGLIGCKTKENTPIEHPEDKEEEVNFSLGYGDYVTYQEDGKESIEKTYMALTQEITSSIQGIFQSNYQKGALDFFDLDNFISIQLEISEDTLQQLNKDYLQKNKESYRECNLNIAYKGLKFHYENVGIRQKGNTSRGNVLDENNNINLRHYKLSFSETFDDEFRENPLKWTDEKALEYRENRNFFGLEKLILRWNRNQDSTYLREYYANEVYRNNGVLAPHCNLVQLEMKIKDQVENLGIYLAMEDISKDFIKRNVVKEYAGGDLYKLGWTNVGARLDSLDASLFGVEEQIKEQNQFKQITYPYDLKTNKKKSQHEAIKAFIGGILSTSTSEFSTFLKNSTIYESVLSYLSVSYLLGDPDDLRGNFNNTYLYFTKNSSLALFIPTDQDRPLGSTGGTGNPTGHHGVYNEPFDTQTGYERNTMPLFEKSILSGGNQQIQREYIARIHEVVDAGWLDIKTFNHYYSKALQYKSRITLGKHVNGKEIPFSLKEVDQPEDEGNLSIEVYLTKKKETFLKKDWYQEITEEVNGTSYYLRGEMNGWDGIEAKYQFKLVNNIPTLVCELSYTTSFKVASSDWKNEWNYSSLEDATLCECVGEEKNIRVKEAGTYKIQIIEGKLWMTKI